MELSVGCMHAPERAMDAIAACTERQLKSCLALYSRRQCWTRAGMTRQPLVRVHGLSMGIGCMHAPERAMDLDAMAATDQCEMKS